MKECLECGGTGVNLRGEKCGCGIEFIETVQSDIEKYIPVVYRGESGVGEYTDCRDIPTLNLRQVLDKFIEDPIKHPSVILDLSETSEGAYTVYYYLIERLIHLNNDSLPQDIAKYIMVNDIEGSVVDNHKEQVKKGNWYPLVIITEFPLKGYGEVLDKIKVHKFSRYPSKVYPLNVYQIKFKDKGVV